MPIKSELADVDVPCVPFHEMIFSEMQRYGNEVALINNDTNETFTFEDILLKTKYIAKSLLAMGIEKGEPIILCVPNCPEFVWLFLGISLAGGIVCPLHPSFSKGLFFYNLLPNPREATVSGSSDKANRKHNTSRNAILPVCNRCFKNEMRLQIMDSTSRFAFVVPHALDNVSAVFNELNIDHRNINFVDISKNRNAFRSLWMDKQQADYHLIKEAYDLPNRGEYILSTTLFHDTFGRDVLFSSLSNGATVVTFTDDVETLAKCIHAYKVKTLFVNPTTLRHLCNTDIISQYPYYHLKTVVIGTEAIREDTIKRAYRCLPSVKHFSAVYEMTEAGIISRTTKLSPFIYRSCGTLCAGLSMMVIDMISGVEVGINEQGLILLRGQTVVSPYWKNDKATLEDFQRNGWRNTGDIGFYDKDGNVFLVDREKQVIKVDGFQVTPQELESILLTHPSIAEAAIVPATKVNQQEIPVAFVVLKPCVPATAEQIKEFINERVMRHKQVDVVVIAMTLPRSPGGKILWRLLREAANRYT
uniref:4-coumarate--CoA ligase 1-like n=1 Tax=Elaeophora elaphi TaxID=1147741 RepID=A0A0R3RXJ8_9BILA